MSDLLFGIVGQHCSIKNDEEEYLTGSADVACEVLDADEEWIKIAYEDRTGRRVIRLERTETLASILVYGS